MSKFRKILIAVLAACMTVCAGVALAACKPDGPDVKNPDNPNPGGVFKGNYVVSVESRGGLGLNNVRIAVEKNGVEKFEGSSVEGKINFTLDPDEYDIVLDESTLPAGYYYSSNEKIKTKAENGNVKIVADSKVITSEAPAGTTYKKGDVMYDFTFNDAVDGTSYTLSETLKVKKAVMINFWGTTCGPCMAEFPAINKAYEAYQERLEIFALSSYNNDTKQNVIDFKTKGGYNFPVALDEPNLSPLFQMGQTVGGIARGWPTTVIIDRYGVIAYINSGTNSSESAWKALFNKYTSASYSQSVDINEGNDEEVVYEERPENIEMPDSAAIAQALAGSGTEIDNCAFALEDEKAWPWTVEQTDGKTVLSVPTANAGATYSVVRFDMKLKPLEGIKFRYNLNTHSDNNVLFMIMDGSIYWEYSQDSEGWKEETVKALNSNGQELYYARSSRTVRITLMYMKSDAVNEPTPVSVDDFTAYNVAQESNIKDFAISVVDGLELDKTTHSYGDIVEYDAEDNLYYTYYTDEKGARERVLLVADINKLAAWTDIHFGDYYFNYTYKEDSGNDVTSNYEASLYAFAFYLMSNWQEADNETVYEKIKFDSENIIFLTYTLQNFSDTHYVPVTPKLRNILIEFTKEAYKDDYRNVFNFTDEWYEDQWLEFCYYFRHYGDAHEGNEICYKDYNAVKGLSFEYAEKIEMDGKDKVTQNVHITKLINYFTNEDTTESGGGIKYKFTPEKDGIYIFTSFGPKDDFNDPYIRVVDFTTHRFYENEADIRYDKIFTEDGELNTDFYLIVEMKAGREYGITATVSPTIMNAQLREIDASYTLQIEYVGTYLEIIRTSTSGAGFWTWHEDENGNPVTDANGQIIFYYMAANVALDPSDGKYYLANGSLYGEKIFIDFVHYNYFGNYRPLKELIYGYDIISTEGKVHVDGVFGANTDKMKAYYEESIAGKATTDWDYGLLHANSELVIILSNLAGELVETNDWQQFACYKVAYGVKPQ